MTVSSTTRRAGPFTGNGVTTAFPFTFKVFAANDLEVSHTSATGVVTVLTLNTHYTVALNANQDTTPGGTVTYPISGAALASPATLTLIGAQAYEQLTDISNASRFLPQVIEDAIDRVTIFAQQLLERFNRTLIYPVGDSASATLPSATSRAGKFFAFDAVGAPTAASGTGNDSALRTDLAASGGSALAGFLAAGVGTVPRTTQAKQRDIFSVRDCGAVGDGVTDDTAAIQNAVTACSGGNLLLVPPGNYKTTAVVTLPRSIKILGASKRGLDSTSGSNFIAGFAGPVFRYAPGVLTPADIELTALTIKGNKATYGAGNGVEFTNAADILMRECTVASFGTDNIKFTGGYGGVFEGVYSAQAGNANFNIEGEKCTLFRCQADAGVYSVYANAAGYELLVLGGVYEGATTRAIHLLGVRSRVSGAFLRSTTAGAKGLYLGANMCAAIGNEIFGSSSVLGLEIPAGIIEYRVVGNRVVGYGTAGSVADGFGAILGNTFEGITTGLETTSGSFVGTIVGNMITGPTSLKHNSGNKFVYSGNRYDDGAGAYKAPTVVAGQMTLQQSPTLEVSVYNSVAQAVPNLAYTALTFDTESFDTASMHSTSATTSRLTAPVAGTYRLSWSIQFAPSAVGNVRTGRIRKNGATAVTNLGTCPAIGGGNGAVVQGSKEVALAAAEYVELEAYQDTGGALNAEGGANSTWFEMVYVSE